MIAACMRPDLVGLVLIAGALLSFWAGVHGANPMRYAGGLLGGSWLATLTSDLGHGIFDGSWLVANFNNLNPANTIWTKQFNVWKDPGKQDNRYLGFEKWWGDFINLRGEEMRWMLENLFIGNKFSTAQIVTQEGKRLDLREIKSPIICFCSKKDNITPPQQALDWMPDNYRDVNEIQKAGQTDSVLRSRNLGASGHFRRHEDSGQGACRVYQPDGAHRLHDTRPLRYRDHRKDRG